MFRRRIRSALFIDFENMIGSRLASTVPNWLAWLEDGHFDGGRRRWFDELRIYWNSASQKYRDEFQRHGFKTVLCERYARLKNGADIRIALDIAEMVHHRPSIKEYVLLSRDTDFVPVLSRLTEHSKRSAILVDEADSAIYTTFAAKADIVIPTRLFAEALRYERPPRRSIGTWLKRPPRPSPVATTELPTVLPAQRLAPAVQVVLAETGKAPKSWTARRQIIRALRTLPGFTTSGRDAYLGYGNYVNLMLAIGRLEPALLVERQGNGVAVKRRGRNQPSNQNGPCTGKAVDP